jgi:hypothetical protein
LTWASKHTERQGKTSEPKHTENPSKPGKTPEPTHKENPSKPEMKLELSHKERSPEIYHEGVKTNRESTQ